METTGAGPLGPADNHMDVQVDGGVTDGNVSNSPTPRDDAGGSRPRNDIDITNRYRATDVGPYYVFVEHKDKNIGRLFPMRVGYYLRMNNEFKKSIVDIKVVGRNRVKVILNSLKAANEMIDNDLLTKNGLISYIPRFFTQKKGVLKMIDTYFSDEFLLTNIESNREVVEVKRLERKVVGDDGKERVVKRQIVVVSFRGNSLPQEVRINGVLVPVEPFVHPVVQCFRCLRYGHTSFLCQRTESCCRKCGKDHKEEDCDEVSKCIYCDTMDHPTISRRCPVYQKQKRIKERMSTMNISFKEAEAIENNPSYAKVVTNNRYQILDTLENFPALRSTNTTTQMAFTKPRNQQANRSGNKGYNGAGQIQKQSQHKKRKAAKSPIVPSSPVAETSSPLAIPNPYAREFREYKQKLLDRVSSYVEEVVQRLAQNSDSLFTFNIKESLGQILSEEDNKSHKENCDNNSNNEGRVGSKIIGDSSDEEY